MIYEHPQRIRNLGEDEISIQDADRSHCLHHACATAQGNNVLPVVYLRPVTLSISGAAIDPVNLSPHPPPASLTHTHPRGGGGYSTQGWVSTVKVIEKVVLVNPSKEHILGSGHPPIALLLDAV